MGSGGPTENDAREALRKLDPLWDELFPAEKEQIVKLLVAEVIVSHDGLLIRLRVHRLNSLVAELQGDGPAEGADGRVEPGKDGHRVDVHVPMGFKTRGGRKEITLPPEAETEPKARPSYLLGVALARAFKWQEMLDTQQAKSLDGLAAKHPVDRSYLGPLLQLTSLAPDIVKAILAGVAPDAL
jgi:hypothetical protein